MLLNTHFAGNLWKISSIFPLFSLFLSHFDTHSLDRLLGALFMMKIRLKQQHSNRNKTSENEGKKISSQSRRYKPHTNEFSFYMVNSIGCVGCSLHFDGVKFLKVNKKTEMKSVLSAHSFNCIPFIKRNESQTTTVKVIGFTHFIDRNHCSWD